MLVRKYGGTAPDRECCKLPHSPSTSANARSIPSYLVNQLRERPQHSSHLVNQLRECPQHSSPLRHSGGINSRFTIHGRLSRNPQGLTMTAGIPVDNGIFMPTLAKCTCLWTPAYPPVFPVGHCRDAGVTSRSLSENPHQNYQQTFRLPCARIR